MNLRLWSDLLGLLAGLLEALLLMRLIAQLFAVRPDQEIMQYVLLITALFIQPLSFLDKGQALFGARLEFSTLLLCIGLLMVWAVLRVGRSKSRFTTES